MYWGIALSAVCHGGMLIWALLAFAGPKPFEPVREQAIMVEVVPPKEAAQEEKKQEEKKQAANQEVSKAAAAQPNERTPEAGQWGAQPQATAPQAPPLQEPVEPPPQQFSMLDPAGLALFNMRPGSSGFDAKADQAADLRADEVAAFKAHLRKCWRLPGSAQASSSTRVVIRVALSPDGELAGEPTLVEASASRDGPAVYQAAMSALAQCQPYSFLPRDRYREWKVLDVTFTPRDMAGG